MARTVSRLGQANLTGDVNALFLKQFGGITLGQFRRNTTFMPRHIVRQIKNGRSAQFPVFGKTTAGYHTPGNEITGGAMAQAERVITIDDLLLSSLWIYELDEAKNHYDVRKEYAFQMGNALSQVLDNAVARVGILAARSAATITGTNGGTVIENASAATDADELVQALFDAAQALDEKDVPETERAAFVTPAQYNLLVNSANKAIHKDYGGSGSIAKGVITEIAGLEIVKTNNLPNGTNVATGPSAYQGDFTNTVALVMHRSAVGTLQLMQLRSEMTWEANYQGWLLISKLAVGHGILRPEAAVEITTDDGEA